MKYYVDRFSLEVANRTQDELEECINNKIYEELIKDEN